MPASGDASIREFMTSRDHLAIRLSSTDLSGLFVKKLVVPYNSAALVFHSTGETTLLSAGQEMTGKFEAVLAKTGEIHVSLGFLGLRSQENAAIDGRTSFAVLIDTRTVAQFKAFARFSGGKYLLKDLEAFLSERTRAGMAQLAASRAIRDLHRKDLLPEIEDAVNGRLAPHLMGTGLLFDRALSGGFLSTDFERRQDQATAADAQARDRERRLKEVAEFLQKEESIQKLLSEIDEPRLKLVVYRELIEGKARDGADDWLRLDEGAVRKIHEIMQKTLGGPSGDVEEILLETAERVYASLGSKVVEIDPSEPEGWKEHDLKEAVRSVRPATVSGRDLLLVGGKRTCILYDPSSQETFPFPLPGDSSPRGGINAVDAYGNTLYATHSEFGLALWDMNQPGRPGELVFQSLTSGHKTTRAVRVAKDQLVFATGPSAYTLDLSTPNGEPKRYTTSHGAITSTVLTSRTLFAATEEGVIVAWEQGKPDYPEVLLRKTSPVTSLRLTKGSRGIAHLLYAFNDTSIHARVLGQNLETEYEAQGGTFTTIDAASDWVAACGHRSRQLFLWRSDNPRRPERTIDLSKVSSHEIMDVALRRRLVLK
ncbi:MAG TPA: hypothetical protein VI643_05765 [Planctomycetota bacterium]|nr:hypothetical protein [Planctomycetota bacterium]